MSSSCTQGILLVDKPLGITSFGVIAALRRLTRVKKIGHCGTLDPMASGLLVCLIGQKYTRMSASLSGENKSYLATIKLGASTSTFDQEGILIESSSKIPTREEIEKAIAAFQGQTLQTPPIFSAKKIRGQKACDLARKGKPVALEPHLVNMDISLKAYDYPLLTLEVHASKGTYIRSLAHDIGQKLTSFAYLFSLRRLQSGSFSLDQAVSLDALNKTPELIAQYLKSDSYV